MQRRGKNTDGSAKKVHLFISTQHQIDRVIKEIKAGRYSIDVELEGSLSKETLLDAAR